MDPKQGEDDKVQGCKTQRDGGIMRGRGTVDYIPHPDVEVSLTLSGLSETLFAHPIEKWEKYQTEY